MATKRDITVGSLWKPVSNSGEQSEIIVTEVDDDLVEYAFPHIEQVFYLSKDSFMNNYGLISNKDHFNKEALLTQLRKSLLSLKEKGQGDQVYALLDSMGI